MRLILVTDGIWPFVIGGMEKHSYYLASMLAEAGVEITLVHPCISEGDRERLQDIFTTTQWSRINWVEVPTAKRRLRFPGHYILENYLYSRNVFQVLENLPKCDFIYAKGLTAWYLVPRKNKLHNVPIGVNAHGYEMFQKPSNLRVCLTNLLLQMPFRFIIRRADYVFSYGGHITTLLKRIGVSPGRVIEIPTGISKEWLRRDPIQSSERKRFVFIGRFERRKGIEELQEVLMKLERGINADFHFISPIPEGRKISRTNVVYHGQLSDPAAIRNILQKSDVLIVPSHSEGMPNVVLEGMASGCAVIATDVGAVKLMVDKDNGWLIAPRDAHALEQAILEAVQMDGMKMQQKKMESIEKVKGKFMWDKIARFTLQALAEKGVCSVP